MVGYSPSATVRSVPPGRVMRMVLARSARAKMAQQHDRFAIFHIAEVELLAEEHGELGLIERFVHGASPCLYSAACRHTVWCPLGLALWRSCVHSSRSRAALRKSCSLPA